MIYGADTRWESNPAPEDPKRKDHAVFSSLNATDQALMLLPYEEWISVSTAARRAKIDKSAAISVVREGRRRGVLCTRGKGPAQQVKRVYPGPRRADSGPVTPRR